MSRACFAVLAFAMSVPVATAQWDETLVLEHANVLSGDFGKPLMDQTVVITKGQVVSVSPGKVGPQRGRRIDLGGAWLLPGLIDAHVHTSTLADARRMLSLGVTTGRSMFAFNYADEGLAALHERGAAEVPTILAAGYPVVASPQTFKPDMTSLYLCEPDLYDLLGRDRIGADGARRLVRANAHHNVKWIKVFANDRAGVLAMDPATRNLSDEELAAAVGEAKRLGLPAAAHTYSDDGGAAAVRAGVRTVEHGALLTEPTLRLMKENGVCFTPTLAGFYFEVGDRPNMNDEQKALQTRVQMLLEHLLAAITTARRLGVPIIAGTDTGYEEGEPTVLDEIEHLAEAGLTRTEALQAATSTSAECLYLGEHKGYVREGLDADLVAYRADPRDDLKALRHPVLVVNAGKVFLDEVSAPQR